METGRGTGITRRSLLRGATVAAAVGLGGSALAACSNAAKAAKPTTQQAKITLLFEPNGPTNKTGLELYQQALQPWLRANPGVNVKLVPQWGSFNVQAILGGTGADVIWDNYPPRYLAPTGNLLLPLDKLIQQDAVDVTKWSSSQINSYRTAAPDHGLYMLPNYFSPLAYVVRLSDFDSAGFERPNPNWTSTEFATACRQMTGRLANGDHRVGAVIQWYSTTLADAEWPFYAFPGGNGMITSQGLADLTSPSAIAAGKFLYEQLFWPGYATTRDLMGPLTDGSAVVNDQVSIQLVWGSLPLSNAQQFAGIVWDYYLPPAYPQGPTCMGTDDFFAIPTTTKYPEQAWSLLKFLTYDASPTGWQQQRMKISLIQPCLNALWDTWEHTLQTVAPPLRGKNLGIFKTMALNGRAFPEEYFPVGDALVQNVPNAQITALWKQTTSVESAFKEIQHQLNGTLAPLVSAATEEVGILKSIAAVTPGPTANYPPPSAGGGGNPPVPAANYAVHQGGTWTVLGAGADIAGTGDDLIFSCQSTDQSEQTWTCRLTAIANISEQSGGQPGLYNWTRAGLMARGDLSPVGAFAAIFVTGSYGFDFLVRPAPGAALQETKFILWKNQGQVQQLLSPVTTPASNYVIHPVWLRLTRKGTQWSPYGSLDGQHFTLLAPAQTAEALAGAFVGLATSAHSTGHTHPGYFRATFDHLTNFTPTQTVAIGQQGLPPQAGAVPANWATQPSLGVSG